MNVTAVTHGGPAEASANCVDEQLLITARMLFSVAAAALLSREQPRKTHAFLCWSLSVHIRIRSEAELLLVLKQWTCQRATDGHKAGKSPSMLR